MPDDADQATPGFKAALTNMNVKTALAFFLVLIAALMVFTWMLRPPKVGQDGLDAGTIAMISGMIMLFIKMAADAIGFQFNSSAGSEQKDKVQAEVQSKLADKVAPAAPAPPVPTTDQLGEALLSNGERTYFRGLTDETAKKAFLAMSSAERQATIAKT